MALVNEITVLRVELAKLAARDDYKMRLRYSLHAVTWSERFLSGLGAFLQKLGLSRGYPPGYEWRSSLKHGHPEVGARPLLVWGVGTERAVMRQACEGLVCHLEATPGYLPVLVTGVADFAYFSRLGWLIEYVPTLSGAEESYRARKLAYLAWRYREALAVPLSAGLVPREEWKGLVK